MTTTPATSTTEKDIGVANVATKDPYGSTGYYQEGIGDLQVLKVSESDNVKLDKDGITVLIPQPSDDPNDPVSQESTCDTIVSYLTEIYSSIGLGRRNISSCSPLSGHLFLQTSASPMVAHFSLLSRSLST